jgi:antitoxin MazE
MKTVNRTRLVKIGNSQGIRIPKALIDQLGLGPEIELVVEQDHLEIHRSANPREGWAEQLREMVQAGEDKMLDPYVPTKFDEEEWEW